LADSLDSLPAFEEQMWQQAAVVRQHWLRLGAVELWGYVVDLTTLLELVLILS